MQRLNVTIESDLFEESQEASLREHLAVRKLLSEITSEFELPEGQYTLYLKSNGQMLNPEKTFEQCGVRMGAVLVLRGIERARPVESTDRLALPSLRPIQGARKAYLQEERTGTWFEIHSQPALIGRPDTSNPQSAALLVVNLGELEGAKSVSRNHAQITETQGLYLIQALSESNPTYVNDSPLRLSEPRVLAVGDTIRVGRFTLGFALEGDDAQ